MYLRTYILREITYNAKNEFFSCYTNNRFLRIYR